MPIQQVTKDNLEQILGNHEWILLDFWAEWCDPCKNFKKVVETLAPHYPEFVFASINIEEEKELAEEFHVRSIPFVMILRNRAILYADSGALTASVLSDLLNQAKHQGNH